MELGGLAAGVLSSFALAADLAEPTTSSIDDLSVGRVLHVPPARALPTTHSVNTPGRQRRDGRFDVAVLRRHLPTNVGSAHPVRARPGLGRA